jgi:hypothetical protein
MTDTRDKLNEASFFLKRMKETNRDKNGFRYNLSAFLSAFCSVPEIMNIEFQSIAGFIAWNKLVIFFYKQRNRSIHLRPVSARPNQNQMNIPEIDLTKLTSFSLVAKIGDDGIMNNPVLTRLTNEGKLTVEEVTATTFWFFSDLPLEDNPDNKDVVSLCEEQLSKLEMIVAECEKKYAIS